MGGFAAGFPQGGSLTAARDIERRYLDLGGAIRCRQRAARVIVEGSRAAGIALEDGSEVRADIVICAGNRRQDPRAQ